MFEKYFFFFLILLDLTKLHFFYLENFWGKKKFFEIFIVKIDSRTALW